MPLPDTTQVLVVGAGPNGLAAALTLATLGIKATVVEARSERSDGARGCLIHARTLEVLKTIGLSDNLKDIGIQSKGIIFHAQTNPIFNVDIAGLSQFTEFPFILLTPQSEAEWIFEENLLNHGVKVIRNSKVIGLREDTSSTEGLQVSFEDGLTIRASYVVGADGARSTVRTLAGISFKDPSTNIMYDQNPASAAFMQITLADVILDIDTSIEIRRDVVSWYLNGRIMFCPLDPPGSLVVDKHKSFWRIAIAIPPGLPTTPPRYPDHVYIQNEINERKPWKGSIRLNQLRTAATYRVRSAVADTFFKAIGNGKVLLVGDSAHVHSPTGGQGMNLGICDAVALGRAIAEHIKGSQDDAVLANYSVMRKRTAIQVIQATKRMTAIVNIPNGWLRRIANILMYAVSFITPIRRKVAWRLGGLTYRD
ncbi:hypothetical protein BDP27DRAFT_1320666 [Rhodocollybia butyracea]|uniref:FAD-binding domain-containing protein n=1 Tax=Rhodocollybia butyracea TaxID=206335 RepID=A0A9P5U9S0_9AGAR|nr:hypothetical protein BDP27DRAFT_1320666 [Rhodocollybia butyracea]